MKRTQTVCALGGLVLALAGCQILDSETGRKDPDSLRALLDSPIFGEFSEPMEAPKAGEEMPSHIAEPLAVPQIGGDDVYSFQLRDTSLAEAVHIIAAQAGINIYLDAELDKRIDASFPGVTLDSALQSLLMRNRMRLVEEPSGIFWIQNVDGSQPGMAEFKLKSINAADVEERLQGLLAGDSRVIIDPNQNLVVVRGTQDDVDSVAQYLEAADQLKRQVLIEVSMFEARIKDGFEFGIAQTIASRINTQTLDIMQAMATADNSFSFTIDDQDGDVSATINMVQQHMNLELVSSPTVLAITNTPAVVEVIEEVPYLNSTSTTSNGGGSTNLEEVEFKEVGVKLTVTPTIQEGGVLQISIDQELSEVIDFFLNIPVVDSRHITSQFLVSDRQTIVLGGLMQDRRSEDETGIPVLKDIPILGRIFQSDVDATEKRELLIFLTPRILDPKQAAGLTNAYKDKYREARSGMGMPKTGAILSEEPSQEDEE